MHEYSKEGEASIIISNDSPVVFEGADKTQITSGKEISNIKMPCFYVFEFNNYTIGKDEAAEKEVSKPIYTTLIITGNWKNGVIEGERSFRIPIRYKSGENYGVKLELYL